MHDITIKEGESNKTYLLPSSWQEVPSHQKMRAFHIAYGTASHHYNKLRLLVLFGMPERILRITDPVELYALTECMSWVHMPNKDMPFDVYMQGDLRAKLPGNGFEHGTCMEWAMAQEYYADLINESHHDTERATRFAKLLAATLLRPLDAKGRRTPIHDRLDVEELASDILIKDEVMVPILLYMSGIKSYIHAMYNDWLFKKEGDKEPEAEGYKGPNFGWWGTYMRVAESGVFGTYEQVLNTNFHTVCVHLVQKRQEAEEIKRKQRSPKAQML